MLSASYIYKFFFGSIAAVAASIFKREALPVFICSALWKPIFFFQFLAISLSFSYTLIFSLFHSHDLYMYFMEYVLLFCSPELQQPAV